MATFKCKMCGGTLEIKANETVATCEYCGTQQTLPRLDDDKRANLYDRANHFRRNNEFDKAMGIYEKILNEDNTDAEAYWSLVLCRYGIEYVEDPSTHKRVPTVNRTQFTSIFDDDNYKSALMYADSYQKSIYEAEANTINEIQKGILSISQKEEPFDVFICYKESDNNGRRTPDSVLANDLYHQLTQEGFKVFFSRITLEDKLGSAYEPYIFAALNSAKVMVVLGTKPEYFNAVWVKNEWARYLALIKQGQKKMLIPAYKDMDPYDLPEEFSHLQAQDMSKLGFMQDLIRGIKKITQTDEPKKTVIKETVIGGGSANTAPLIKRAFMFLEDGEWESADEYCEKVLDIEPENAKAYLGKLMAELNVSKQDELKELTETFDDYGNYQKAMRFGDDEVRAFLSGCTEFIIDRNETERKEEIYRNAKALIESDSNDESYFAATEFFESMEIREEDDYTGEEKFVEQRDEGVIYEKIAERLKLLGDYKDSDVLVEKLFKKAEITRKEHLLKEAKRKLKTEISEEYVSLQRYLGYDSYWDTKLWKIDELNWAYTSIIQDLESLGDWDESCELKEQCQQKISELNEIKKECEYKYDLEKERNAVKVAKTKKIGLIVGIAILIIGIAGFAFAKLALPSIRYNSAAEAMENQDYQKALSLYELLGDFKDSEEKSKEARYKLAVVQFENKEYEQAYNNLKMFKNNNAIENSEELLTESQYLYAQQLISEENYENAIGLLKPLYYVKKYEQSKSLLNQSYIGAAEQKYKESDYQTAASYLESADIGDSKPSFYNELYYNLGVECANSGEYENCVNYLLKVGNYSDAKAQIKEARYNYVNENYNNYDETTYKYLKKLKKADYLDSKALYKELYAWKAKLECVNTDPDDYTTTEQTISDEVQYLHYSFSLSGGYPGEEATFYHKTKWPDGDITKSDWYWENEYDGSSIGCEWSDGFSTTSGTITFKIYNKANDELIGSASLKVE